MIEEHPCFVYNPCITGLAGTNITGYIFYQFRNIDSGKELFDMGAGNIYVCREHTGNCHHTPGRFYNLQRAEYHGAGIAQPQSFCKLSLPRCECIFETVYLENISRIVRKSDIDKPFVLVLLEDNLHGLLDGVQRASLNELL